MTPSTFHQLRVSPSSILMSSNADQQETNSNNIGATERLLLDRNRALLDKRNGVVQRFGKTIKKDGLDGVRDVVWKVYFASNYVFTGLGILLVMGLFINVAGYGYYVDNQTGMFMIDTFEHIKMEQFFANEAARLLSSL